jgi:hypothetical protein
MVVVVDVGVMDDVINANKAGDAGISTVMMDMTA